MKKKNKRSKSVGRLSKPEVLDIFKKAENEGKSRKEKRKKDRVQGSKTLAQ